MLSISHLLLCFKKKNSMKIAVLMKQRLEDDFNFVRFLLDVLNS